MACLSDRERDILTFEREWWTQAGSKEQAVRDRFDLGVRDYYRTLSQLLDNDEALAHDPLLVRRLRRLRATRRGDRASRRTS